MERVFIKYFMEKYLIGDSIKIVVFRKSTSTSNEITSKHIDIFNKKE